MSWSGMPRSFAGILICYSASLPVCSENNYLLIISTKMYSFTNFPLNLVKVPYNVYSRQRLRESILDGSNNQTTIMCH